MHVFETCKLRRNQINSHRQKMRYVNFRCSRAVNSIVGGPIWPKFELMQCMHVIMYVFVSSNSKKDRFNSNREKVEKSISRHSKTLRRQLSNLVKIRPHPSFIACPCYLKVKKESDKEQLRKSGNTIFPMISLWVFRRS